MITTIAGTRVRVYSFDDLEAFSPSNVVVVIGNDHVFFCDTYLGPAILDQIMEDLGGIIARKDLVVFNTHGDWDHHWGNCFFKNNVIIGHELTRKYIIDHGKKELYENVEYHRGNITIEPPNKTFIKDHSFPNEHVLIFHSPGHTKDSSSIVDELDKVLYAGDNVEWPVPWLSGPDVDTFIATLEAYLDLDVNVVIPGHGKILAGKELIVGNLEYLVGLKLGDTSYKYDKGQSIHDHNLQVLGLSNDT